MSTQRKQTQPEIQISAARGAVRFTLHLPASEGFPRCVVSAAVIPERFTGTYRVQVTTCTHERTVVVHDLCMANLQEQEDAVNWARECVKAAGAFWQDCA